jgi:hypothetical protein
MQQPAGQEGDDAATIRTRGLREAKREAAAKHEERPHNSNERQWSRRKMQQPTMGRRGNGGWWLQSCRWTGDNTTNSWDKQEQDATRGGGRGEDELADVRQRCHTRQCGNQSGQTRGKRQVD